MRDTVEAEHDKAIGVRGFRRTIRTLNYALQNGMHEQNRLAVEIPVTKDNRERVIYDFVPAMRFLGVIPFPEEYIQIIKHYLKIEKKIFGSGHGWMDCFVILRRNKSSIIIFLM